MCPCDMPTGHVCGHCRREIRDSIMPSDLKRRYYGSWRVDAVEADR